jgi:diguanylate cyclase (GGDEF)-like protein/PAS domain S-box-containing protein
MTEILGYAKEDFKQQGIGLLSIKTNKEPALALFRKTVADEVPSLYELETRHKDGRLIILEVSSTLVETEGNARVLALMRDITSRRQMEENMAFLRQKDPLTGVYNRAFFETGLTRIKNSTHASIAIIICDVDGLKLINDTLGHRQGDDLLRDVATILDAGVSKPNYVARIGGDEYAVIVFNSTPLLMGQLETYYQEKIEEHNQNTPHLPLSVSMGWAMGDAEADIEVTFKTADNNMYRQKLHRSKSVRGSIVRTMMVALEAKDHITEGHAERLSDLIERMGHFLQLPQTTVADMRLLAKFHDIGKVGITDNILKKPSKLSDEEMAIMRQHCEIGYRIAKSSPDLEPIADFILKHQEHWDGTGYPLGISGEQIPIECRILGIIDAFDAMTNDRPYRAAMTKEAACQELLRCAGTQFDPELVKLFLSLQEE